MPTMNRTALVLLAAVLAVACAHGRTPNLPAAPEAGKDAAKPAEKNAKHAKKSESHTPVAAKGEPVKTEPAKVEAPKAAEPAKK